MNGSLAHADSHVGTPVMDRGMLGVADVVARVRRIQEVMSALMKEGTHYGKIPGTDKPTLYKPGAELILTTFRIAATPSLIEDLSTSDEVRYRVTVRGTNQITGEVLGEMVGECSSNEEKYRWRRPVCDEEFDETSEDRRREKWAKGWDGKPNYKQKQLRTSPADVANTILKMAVKRALIAMTLVATGCSDIFAQDLEDLSEELRDSIGGSGSQESERKKPAPPQRKSQAAKGQAPTNDLQSTDPVLIGKVEQPSGKKFFRIEVQGDQRYFTAWPEDAADAIVAAKKFSGEDVKAVITFIEKKAGDKSYYNVKKIEAAPVEQPAEPKADREPGDDDGDLPTAGDIFGGKK